MLSSPVLDERPRESRNWKLAKAPPAHRPQTTRAATRRPSPNVTNWPRPKPAPRLGHALAKAHRLMIGLALEKANRCLRCAASRPCCLNQHMPANDAACEIEQADLAQGGANGAARLAAKVQPSSLGGKRGPNCPQRFQCPNQLPTRASPGAPTA